MKENGKEPGIYEFEINWRHACHLWGNWPLYNLDKEAKAQKFLRGLKLKIQLALSSLGIRTYAKVVLQALIVESNVY